MSDIEVAVGAFAILSTAYYNILRQKQRKRPRRRRWWVITLHRLRNQGVLMNMLRNGSNIVIYVTSYEKTNFM